MKHAALSMGILVSVAGSALAQNATLSIELVEINGFDVTDAPAASGTASPFDILTVEVFIRDWSPSGQELREYQFQIDSAGYTSGIAGDVLPNDWATTTNINGCFVEAGDPNLTNAFIDVDGCSGNTGDPVGSDVGTFWGNCHPCDQLAGECLAGNLCGDPAAPSIDWLHGGISLSDLINFVVSTSCDYLYVSELNQGVAGPSSGAKLYAGTVLLKVSADADGTFTLCLDPADTILVDTTGANIPVAGHECLTLEIEDPCLTNSCCFNANACVIANPCIRSICDSGAGTCANHPRWLGDANHDGRRNVVDVVCVSRVAFQDATDCGGFPICCAETDYGPVPGFGECGDGILNIVDVVVTARAAFQDLDDICCGFTFDQTCAEVTGNAPHCPK